jgi:DNA-binding LytR/AlgR family response regulator
MKVLIIEDEMPARAKLVQMLKKIDAETEIVAQLGSVRESVQWIRQHPAPDCAFVDIQLSDDHSFTIFNECTVRFPLIFTTAYDKYLLESFEYNSIEYLLKPITEEKLKRAISKLRNLKEHFLQDHVLRNFRSNSKTAKRLMVKKGTEYFALPLSEVAYFYTEHKVVFVKDFYNRKFILSETISELEERFREEQFFRLNRKFLAHFKAIEKFKPDNGKILVSLKPEMKEEVFVSKETAPAFRNWMSTVS